MRNDFESDYLMHHGILGQKWYHRNGPPYPLDAKDHSAAEKKAGWMKSLSGAIKDHKKKKQRTKALEKARQARAENAKKAAEQRAYEDEKQKVLKSGKASEILKYKGDLTNQELQSAVARLDWEKRLGEISAKEQKSNWDKMDDLMNKVGKVTDYVNKSVNAYDAIKRATKIFEGDKDKKKEEEKKAHDEFMEKIINSRNIKIVKRYAPLMTNKELNAAMKGVDYKKELEEDYKSDRELKKEAKKAEKQEKKETAKAERDAKAQEKKEERKAEKEKERQREAEEFFNGPDKIDDDYEYYYSDRKKRKK